MQPAELAGEDLDKALRFLAWQHGGMVATVAGQTGFDELRAHERGRIREMRLAREKGLVRRLSRAERRAGR